MLILLLLTLFAMHTVLVFGVSNDLTRTFFRSSSLSLSSHSLALSFALPLILANAEHLNHRAVYRSVLFARVCPPANALLFRARYSLSYVCPQD